MKTVLSETEVNRVAPDAITLGLQKLPYDGQDELDRTFAEHFFLKALASKVNSRLKKLDDAAKDEFKSKPDTDAVTLSKNYRREISEGNPRELFDLETFIKSICEAYPDVMAHRLRELASHAKKSSAAPISITVEYIGDLARKELP